jgi:hypothetical protein
MLIQVAPGFPINKQDADGHTRKSAGIGTGAEALLGIKMGMGDKATAGNGVCDWVLGLGLGQHQG